MPVFKSYTKPWTCTSNVLGVYTITMMLYFHYTSPLGRYFNLLLYFTTAFNNMYFQRKMLKQRSISQEQSGTAEYASLVKFAKNIVVPKISQISESHTPGVDLSGFHVSGFHVSGFHVSGFHVSGFHVSECHVSGFHVSGCHVYAGDEGVESEI